MDTPTIIALCSLAIALTMAALGIAEKIWGGGNALAGKFATLKEDTTAQISTVRNDHQEKLDEYAQNTRVGVDSIRSNIHLLEKSILESRLELAQQLQLYMRRESFYKATDDLKRDFKDANTEIKSNMKDGFARIETTLGEMTQAIEAARKHNQA